MKKILFIIIFSIIIFALFPVEKISQKQDKQNSEYLKQLDSNLNGTIGLLTAFNDSAAKLPEIVTGADVFARFLMELTLECSNLKKSISESARMTAQEREILIQELISSLNPEVKFLPFFIDQYRDEQNRELMKIMRQRIIEHALELQKKILLEEAGVIESKTFHKYFFNLHSQHFVYQLLLDFLEPSELLSRDNRDYLLKMAHALEDLMMEENEFEEK